MSHVLIVDDERDLAELIDFNLRAAGFSTHVAPTGEAALSGIEHILADVLLTSKVRESQRLASSIQTALVSKLGKHYDALRDLGVKRAPFYVLTGAIRPAVLVETAFISNPVESKRLRDPQYRTRAADALVTGIEEFVYYSGREKGTGRRRSL